MTLSSFYQSDEWAKLRTALMLERGMICEYCGKPIVKKYDAIGHHKIPLTDENVDDVSISLNPENIMLVHHRCHNMIHERFGGACRKVYLVWGSPCSGKSTWVKENAEPGDLVVDIDRIWEAISTVDRYHKPPRLKANVFALRDALLDQVRTRKGMWNHAFVIGGYPLKSERDRLCSMLGAEPIRIDTGKEACLERAQTAEWRQFVLDWWDALPPDE